MGEQKFVGKLMGGCCPTWGINDQTMPRTREFNKCIFQ